VLTSGRLEEGYLARLEVGKAKPLRPEGQSGDDGTVPVNKKGFLFHEEWEER
jgi:hypothetical protein